jgi:putative oxidoreductase
MSNHRSADIGLLILRVGAGVMLLLGHGWGKLMHFSERVGSFADPIHLGPQASFMLVVFAEVFCSALVAVGLMTRLAVIPLVIFFLVAGLIQHADDPWNRKELAFLFLVAFPAAALHRARALLDRCAHREEKSRGPARIRGWPPLIDRWSVTAPR